MNWDTHMRLFQVDADQPDMVTKCMKLLDGPRICFEKATHLCRLGNQTWGSCDEHSPSGKLDPNYVHFLWAV